jgi:hypothetical protein
VDSPRFLAPAADKVIVTISQSPSEGVTVKTPRKSPGLSIPDPTRAQAEDLLHNAESTACGKGEADLGLPLPFSAQRRCTSTERTVPDRKSTEQENENQVVSNPRFALTVPLTQSLRPGLLSGIVRPKVT